MYVCAELFYFDFTVFLLVLKILLSLLRMSRVFVTYWQTKTPFIFIPDADELIETEYPARRLHEKREEKCCFLRVAANSMLLLPYYLEALTLSCKNLN